MNISGASPRILATSLETARMLETIERERHPGQIFRIRALNGREVRIELGRKTTPHRNR